MTQDSQNRGVYDALSAIAAIRPHSAALVFDGTQVTFAELVANIDRAAHFLVTRGVQRGSVFAAYGQNCPEILYLYYAAARMGAIFVPLNPNLTAEDVGYSIADSGAMLLFHDEHVADPAAAAVPAHSRVLLSDLTENADGQVPIDAPAPIDDDDDFLIIYTSGTTGKQKAIVLSQRSIVTGANSLMQMWAITSQDTTLVALPLGYLYGLSTAAAATLQAGGTVYLLPRFHPRLVLEGLIESHATVFHGVPTMFSMMLEYTEQRGLSFDLTGVRRMICAGAPLPLPMLERFEKRFRSRLENYYAMTEATPVFGQLVTSHLSPPAGSAGSLAPGARVRIVRPDGTECDDGEQGELLVHAPQTMSRYWNDPQLTAASFRDGYFRSGDLGRRDPDGFFSITGRMKDIIIRGGANISPSEVEHVLAEHPSVQDAAVIGVDDRIYGEVPVAFVVLRPGAAVTREELEQYGDRRLADFKVPRRIFFETALPVGKTGKVDKTALRRRFADLPAAEN